MNTTVLLVEDNAGDVRLTQEALREGKVKKVIASIGGFLSIGARNVEMSFEELKPVSDGTGGTFLKANYTRDQLKAIPEWQAPGTAR